MNRIASLDRQYVWHPFTQMKDWLQREPIVLSKGKGTVLWDVHGRQYLDANSSIWTNLHGHNHPKLNGAISRQLKRVAHTSSLGFASQPASLLAEQLVRAANPSGLSQAYSSRVREPLPGVVDPKVSFSSALKNPKLSKVFFSDNGSTAMEVALKMAYEYSRRSGRASKPRFLSLRDAYHGDTVGAVSLGHIDLFHKAYSGLLFKSDHVMAPYCYRCPFNRAKPSRADARECRSCRWECLDQIEQRFETQKKRGQNYSGFVFEPLMQGAAGVIAQPRGWLARAASIARGHGALLIADEVMTGFGRMGTGGGPMESLFACHQEGVQPDFLSLAKGLTGGYLPMAATLTTQAVFDAFLGDYEEFKTFFHGHTFTGNQLGSAVSLASLDILQGQACARSRRRIEDTLRESLAGLWQYPQVGDLRQSGLVVGVELVVNWQTRQPFDLRTKAGICVCEAMARRGVLTRPVGNVVLLMPPYSSTKRQVQQMVAVLGESIGEVFGRRP